MKQLLAWTAVAVVLGLAPGLAAESQSGQLPITPGTSADTAKSAQQPSSGSADTSGGAAEQSSASPSSGAATDGAMDQPMQTGQGQPDQSGGAKEQSSAPQGSSAGTGQPNPTLGQQNTGKRSNRIEWIRAV
jgi:hypothetical protein